MSDTSTLLERARSYVNYSREIGDVIEELISTIDRFTVSYYEAEHDLSVLEDERRRIFEFLGVIDNGEIDLLKLIKSRMKQSQEKVENKKPLKDMTESELAVEFAQSLRDVHSKAPTYEVAFQRLNRLNDVRFEITLRDLKLRTNR